MGEKTTRQKAAKRRRDALAIVRCECVSYDVMFLAVTRAQNTEWREKNGKQGHEYVCVCVWERQKMAQERGTRLDKASPARSKACTLIHHSSIRELRGLRGITNKQATLDFSLVYRMVTV